jgi:hypothetical protein
LVAITKYCWFTPPQTISCPDNSMVECARLITTDTNFPQSLLF